MEKKKKEPCVRCGTSRIVSCKVSVLFAFEIALQEKRAKVRRGEEAPDIAPRASCAGRRGFFSASLL